MYGFNLILGPLINSISLTSPLTWAFLKVFQVHPATAVLTDLSKAFDCLNHDLLIAKFEAYGFNIEALTFIQDNLSNRSQRTKENSEYSFYRDIKYGILQGSTLGPLLFNIFLNNIFFFVKDSKITNYYSVCHRRQCWEITRDARKGN